MPIRPVTIAARVLHYGRYGSGAEDQRLYPLFVGYPDLVRGYDTGSFSASECGTQANGSCPVFDSLVGSRMLVGTSRCARRSWASSGSATSTARFPWRSAPSSTPAWPGTASSKPTLFGGDRPLAKSNGRDRARERVRGARLPDRLRQAPRPSGEGRVLRVQPADGLLDTATEIDRPGYRQRGLWPGWFVFRARLRRDLAPC